MSLTRGHSCVLCQQRKVRCDQQKPCSNCMRAQVECKVAPPQPARRKKRKLHEEDLVDRLRKYEALMTRNGIDFTSILDSDGSNNEMGNTGAATLNYPEPATRSKGDTRKENSKKRSKWFAYYDEYQTTDDMIHGSDDDEHEQPTIHQAFDTMFDNTDGFPFKVGGTTTRITRLHPSAIQIFQLWQVYLNNANPLLKISHVPTLQNKIVKAGADLASVSKPLEALMFSIYLIAITSMPDEEVQSTFKASKKTLLAQYHEASQHALINAGFMRSTDLMTLQAYLLYLLSVGRYVDPRSLFCLIGIAVRVATRLGLHRDGAQFGISPFDTEQRRRLWWQLAILDKRMGEMTGSAITALSSSRTDCRLPLNVNDTDLHKNTKEHPIPSKGMTEMLFCLTRVELLIAAAPSSMRPDPSIVRDRRNNEEVSAPPSFPRAKKNRPSFRGLDDYCEYIESTYLKHCDPKIPIQHFTLLTGRVSLHKLRVVDFMCRGISTSELSEKDREALFLVAVQMIEYDDLIYTTESLRGFHWYTHFQAPMPGFVFLMSELRQRTTGPLCERAWKAICSNHHNRGLICNLASPMHTAFGQATLKAWNAREQAEHQQGRVIEPPELVTILRRYYASKDKGTATQLKNTSNMPESSNSGTNSGAAEFDTLDASADRPVLDADLGGPQDSDFGGSMMFPFIDGPSDMYDLEELGYENTDWSYLIPSGAFGGFSGDFT